MNLGIQDAVALSEALAGVLAGGPDSLLDEYSAARRPIARDVVAMTDRLTRLATLPRAHARCATPCSASSAGFRRRTARWPGGSADWSTAEVSGLKACSRSSSSALRGFSLAQEGGTTIEADYLVIGAGATGLAFVDTLVSETTASVVVVDRNDQPGGHWTTAYPFVRLHQPSAYYGVNSRTLGSDTIDRAGLNAGFYELASGAEVCAYFDAVMQQQLLPTGRVSYLPMSEYLGDGRIRTLGGEDIEVTARGGSSTRPLWMIIVPSMRPPALRCRTRGRLHAAERPAASARPATDT